MAAFAMVTDVSRPCSSTHEPWHLCSYDILHLPVPVLDWWYERLRAYLSTLITPSKLFRRWDIERRLYEMAQRLDYSSLACLYISVNNNQRQNTWKVRISSGLNRNPVENIANKNRRYDTPEAMKNQGWKLLIYVQLSKMSYTRKAVERIKDNIAKNRGLDAKVVFLIDFALKRGERVHIDSAMLCASDRWYMKNVQKYVSKQAVFRDYVETVCKRPVQQSIAVNTRSSVT